MTTRSHPPVVAGGFWGKCRPGVGTHPLVDHCLDVALVLRRLLETSLVRGLRSLPSASAVKDRLAVIAFLHDLGKCNWGFQAKADPEARRTAGHAVEAIALLRAPQAVARWPKPLQELLESACTWFEAGEDALVAMLLASISHHGRPISWQQDYKSRGGDSLARWWLPDGGLDPMAGVAELAAAARAAFPSAFATDAPAIDATPTFQRRFAGLVMLADWIGSDTQFFPYRASPQEERHALAAAAADRAITAIGLAPPAFRQARCFRETFGFPPRPLQDLLGEHLAMDDQSRLALLESDTGSGKTEAALAWFLRLYAEGKVDGLYFALPTRVAARELYGRVLEAIERAFPDAATRPGPVLLGVPGYVRADGRPVLPDPDGALWDDDAAARQRERLWAAERPKRFLAAPVVVGTVDQALLSVLAVKHALMRSVCLDRHLIVVDEVHASDTYMREILQSLVSGHLSRGGRALLLSATLGEDAAARFFDRDSLPLAEATRRPYPSLSTRRGELAVQGTARTKSVELTWLDSLDDGPLVPRLVEAVEAGARVLVVCNTVGRANDLLRAVEVDDRIPRHALFSVDRIVCPHHGRFAREDRERLDAAVSGRLGKGTADGPVLLIGTQTLEQSLDLDADWLVTDLCPMDVLLQRIGRLHRHERHGRPADFARARVLIRVPDGVLSRFVHPRGELRGPAGLGSVYADGRILQCTLDVLRSRDSVTLPADNRLLVEGATHPEAWRALGQEWNAHAQWIEGSLLADARLAVTSLMDDRESFGDWHWVQDGARITTRLGADSIELPLVRSARSPFGNRIERLLVPAHLAPEGAALPEAIDADEVPGGLSFSWGARRYRYSRFGLEKDDA